MFLRFQLLVPLHGMEALLCWCRMMWRWSYELGSECHLFMGFTIYLSNIVWDMEFLVVKISMVTDDAVIASFCVILVDAQGSSGKPMNLCYHFVYACWFD